MKLNQIHDKLRFKKDEVLFPLTKVIPKKVTANYITFWRLVFSVVMMVIASLYANLWFIIIFFMVYFFDLLDGAVARARDNITYVGEKLDTFADRLNHIFLYIVILQSLDFYIFTLRFFLAAETIFLFWVLLESFLHGERMKNSRTLVQFCTKLALWPVLIYEILTTYI